MKMVAPGSGDAPTSQSKVEIDDPVAKLMSNGPAGNSFTPNRLLGWKKTPNSLFISNNCVGYVFRVVMFVAGAGLFYAVFIARAEPVPLLYSLMALLISAAMMLIALFGHKQVSFRFVEGTYRVYDPVLGVFGKGEIRSGSLSEIYAIQLYRSLRTSDSGTRTFRYYSYEVNLVMPTGQRICVFYSGSQDQVEELASLLSKQLTLPVWKSY